MNRPVKPRIKAIILLSTLLFVLSCDFWFVDCGPFPDKYKTVSIDWYALQRNHYDTVYESYIILEGGESVVYDDFVIGLYPVQETYFSNLNRTLGFKFNSVFACSPKEPTTDERISDIQVFADKPYKTGLTKESNLAIYFDVYVVSYFENYPDFVHLPEYLGTSPLVPERINLYLKEPPQYDTNICFTVKYFQDGLEMEYYEFTTDTFTIIN